MIYDSKKFITPKETTEVNRVGRSYYIHCLESALEQVLTARMLVKDDITDENHELPTIETLLKEALQAS